MLTAFILLGWVYHAIAAILLAGPFAIVRRKETVWHMWHLLGLLLPFGIWATCFLLRHKGLANIAVESVFVGVAVGVAAVIRLFIRTGLPDKLVSARLLAGLCIVAAAVYWFTPVIFEQ